MWGWIIFSLLICVYWFLFYWRNNKGKLKIFDYHLRRKKLPIDYVDEYLGSGEDYNALLDWVGKLNELVKYTNMKYYVFVDKLPLLKDSEEEVLYCLLGKDFVASDKRPFFKTYIVTGGLYKELDIGKYW